MSIPIDEQSTTINIDRDKQECDIWTNDSTMITRLDKLCNKAPAYYELVNIGKVNGEIVDKCYIVKDKSLISFRSGKIILSDEQKQARAEIMRNAKKNKK